MGNCAQQDKSSRQMTSTSPKSCLQTTRSHLASILNAEKIVAYCWIESHSASYGLKLDFTLNPKLRGC